MEIDEDEHPEQPDPEQARQDAIVKAFAFLERNPEYPDVLVKIHDQDERLDANRPEDAKVRLSDARFAHELKYVESRGQQFLRLVTDLETVKAVTLIMDDLSRRAWFHFSGIPIEAVPPTSPFATPNPTQVQRDALLKAARHWVMEGYRQIADLLKKQSDLEASPTPKKARRFREPQPQLLANRESVDKQTAALALGTTTRTMDRLIKDNKLMPIGGGGGRKRFRTRDLIKFMDQKNLRQARQNETKRDMK